MKQCFTTTTLFCTVDVYKVKASFGKKEGKSFGCVEFGYRFEYLKRKEIENIKGNLICLCF